MGFCEGLVHTENSNTSLKPIPIGVSSDEVLNDNSQYKKQLDIYKDSSDRIYIKPNEILKLINIKGGKYKIRIYFLRNIKSSLGNFLNLMKNNLIENGNFFAGLEATQTGDLDKSHGKNHFIKIENPGLGPYALNQNGIPGNKYVMEVTGIKPKKSYVFSCWVAWNDEYNGDFHIASFSGASSSGGKVGLPRVNFTDLGGSYIDVKEDAIINIKEINGMKWYRLYSFVQTDQAANLGTLLISLGINGSGFKASQAPLGNRYFTDLRFEEVQSLSGAPIKDYIKKLKLEN
jgi:hypothetical protein